MRMVAGYADDADDAGDTDDADAAGDADDAVDAGEKPFGVHEIHRFVLAA